MTLKEGIQKHLEGKTLDPKIKFDDICEFVTEKARESLNNEPGAIDDTTVFAWVDEFVTTGYVKFYADKEKEEQEQKEREEKREKRKKKKEDDIKVAKPEYLIEDKPIEAAKPNSVKIDNFNKPKQFSDNPLVKGVQMSLFGGDLDDDGSK